MRAPALQQSPSLRQVSLGSLAVAVIVLPEPFFVIVATTPWEVVLLRVLALLGLSLLAAHPWAMREAGDVRRRLRRWAVPGWASSTVYLLSADPVYLLVGLCLLTGASVDVWAARAHEAADSLRTRLRPADGNREG